MTGATASTLPLPRPSFNPRRLVLAALTVAAFTATPSPLATSSRAWVPGPAARRNLLLALPTAALVEQSSPAKAVFFSTDRFDGTYFDPTHPCDQCLININAEGGFATITGKDSPTEDVWDTFAQYEEKVIVADFSSRGGPPRLKGKYFSRKGDKGIEWEDGNTWEKLEYKVNASPYQIVERGGEMRQAQLEAGEIKSRR